MPERNGGTSMPSAPASAPGWSSAAWTHGRTHHAAVIGQQGRLLGDQQFPADRGGYRLLLSWLRRHGNLDAVGVEATGSYGAGLTRVATPVVVGIPGFEPHQPAQRSLEASTVVCLTCRFTTDVCCEVRVCAHRL